MNKQGERKTAFVFGVSFVIVLLALAIAFPDPTPFRYVVFRIVLSLAAAGVAAMVPGFLEVTVPGWIRASGALGVFVVIYFYNPAALVVQPTDTKGQDTLAVSIPKGTSLRNAIEIIAQQRQAAVRFSETCTKELLDGTSTNTRIQEGADVPQVIRALAPSLEVSSPERGLYEIDCAPR